MALPKVVVIHETGEVFPNLMDASKSLRVNHATLGQHISGRKLLKCLKGLTIYTVKEHHCGRCGDRLEDSNWTKHGRKNGDQLCRGCKNLAGYESKDRDPARKRAGKGIGIKTVRMLMEKHDSCNLCGELFEGLDFEIDHSVPKSRGGSNHPENLQLLCHKCNKGKDALTTEEYVAHCKKVAMNN